MGKRLHSASRLFVWPSRSTWATLMGLINFWVADGTCSYYDRESIFHQRIMTNELGGEKG